MVVVSPLIEKVVLVFPCIPFVFSKLCISISYSRVSECAHQRIFALSFSYQFLLVPLTEFCLAVHSVLLETR